jgi:tetratricopeptide (TPR) repeat protein
MTERLERITLDMSEEEALGLILDELMDRAAPDIAEAIRFCAIPHWFNEEIIAWLRGEGREPSQRTREILAELTALTFVGPYHDRGYAYHENVRDLLLRRWRQENAERFQELSGVAAAYYADKLEVEELSEEQRAEWQREEMYHLLVANEERGFDLFEEMFHGARQLYQLSTCDLLLDLAEEQESDLNPDNQLWLRFYKGQVAHASALWDEALEIWEALKKEDLSEGLKGTLANDLGSVYQAKGEWDKAIDYYQRSLAIHEKLGDEHGMSIIFNNLGSVYQAKGEWDKAIDYYQRSLEIKEKAEDEHGIASTFNNLGSVYQAKGEWDKAIEYHRRSLAIGEKIGDEHGMASTFNNLGEVYRVKGEWDKAIDYCQRSLEITQKIGDEYMIGRTFNNLGLVYQAKGEWNKAIDYYQRSLAISQKIGDEYMIGRTFNNLGGVYQAKGEWDKATEYYQRSLEITQRIGDEYMMANTFNNLGGVYQAKGDWDKAIEYHRRSLAIREKVGDEYGMAYNFNNMALLYQLQGRLEEAIAFFEKGLRIFKRIGDKPSTETVQENLEAAKRELEEKKEQE